MTAAELAEAWSAGKAQVDRAALHGDFGAWLHGAVQAGLGRAIDGVLDDNVALFFAPWGFEPVSIAVPVKVWHGAQDRFVPYTHGRWLAEHIQGATADLNEADGHLTVAAERIGDVHATDDIGTARLHGWFMACQLPACVTVPPCLTPPDPCSALAFAYRRQGYAVHHDPQSM